jgi:putative colanic acid biosynthesis acetyltransferase WcaF
VARVPAAPLRRHHGARLPLLSRLESLGALNLVCADQVTAADGAEIYNPAPIRFGSHAILSQDAFVCGATHDYDDPRFPLLAYAMDFGAYAWVCARASVGPGVSMGEGAVLGLGSVATRDLEPWTVYAGVPAIKVKDRKRTQALS